MPEWTKDQLKVIQARNPEILVSAAAGSGKTAVLVERIVTLVKEGYDLNRMLMITFTHAAASEMKEKIRRGLSSRNQNESCLRALENIEISEISTIHSFCQRLIRNQFQAIGKDPDTAICDTATRKLLFSQAFRNAVNLLKEKQPPQVENFRKAYRPEMAESIVKSTYDFLMSLPEPFEWLHRHTENIPAEVNPEHPWFRTVHEMIREKMHHIDALMQAQEKLFAEEDALSALAVTLDRDRNTLEQLNQLIECDHRETGMCEGIKFAKAAIIRNPTEYEKEWKDRFNANREKIKKETDQIKVLLFPDMNRIGKEFGSVAELAEGLTILTETTAQEFKSLKEQKNVIDFNDLEHDALSILKMDRYREIISADYDHIFVDECQDVSAVQDAIIQKIHNEKNTLFMVGDVKQSIYRFRLADPTLFLNRMNSYSDEEDAPQRRIFLQANFRSRPEILETVNSVFRRTMKKASAELDYTGREELHAGRKTDGYLPVMVDLITNDETETKLTNIEAIADHIVSRGTELLQERYEPENRHYTWRDMVILMPKVAGDGLKLTDALTARGVPVFFDGGREYFSQSEIIVIRDLLKLIDFPKQDIPLISVLRNSPFFLTDDELGSIRLCRQGKKTHYYEAFEACCEKENPLGEKCRSIRQTILEWRFLSENLPLSEFLWRILRESNHYALSGAGDHGAQQQANLRFLCAQAAECERNGIQTLHDFLNHMDELSMGGDTLSASLLGEKDNLIRIMTMHKSKGLQFPVVFCVGVEKGIGHKDEAAVQLHNELGVCLHYKNTELRIDRKTIADDVFAWRRYRDETAERIRLLYVAMTRAQERLFIVSCKTEDALWTYPECDARTLSASCSMDWIMSALNDEEKEQSSTGCPQASKPWKIRNYDANQQKCVENRKVIHNMETWLKSVLAGDHVDQLWKTEEKDGKSDSLIKTSVTSLVHGRKPEEIEPENPEEQPEDKRRSREEAEFMRLSELPEYPAFMEKSQKMTAAHRGTVIHHFLSLIDLEALKNDPMMFGTVRSEKERMTGSHLFSEEEKNKIYDVDIVRFFTSDLGDRMLHSDCVRREWNFNLLLTEMNGTILQGIVDCAFREKGEWIILDYKTDRITDEEAFVSEYREQLNWYARAIETLTEEKVAEKWLYALSTGKAYRI